MNKTKRILSTIFAFISSLLGVVAVPFYVLVGCNIIDYRTGIAKTIVNGGQISSTKGYAGILKKISMWLLVLVGFVLDYSVTTLTMFINIDVEFNSIIALIVTFWLIFNEILSILENLNEIGTPVPKFLTNITKYLQNASENIDKDIEK